VSLKQGDKVVMHTCIEAEVYNGKIWTCRTDEFTSSSESNVVFLEGFSSYFLTKYLQLVDLTEINNEIEELVTVISQCPCEECGKELGRYWDNSNGLLCMNCQEE
jgi:hypothetical protein